MLFLCVHSKWLLGKGEKSLFPKFKKGKHSRVWPWVMLCSLAVFSLSSDPPGVALECLKLLNVFLMRLFLITRKGVETKVTFEVVQGLQKIHCG